MIIHYNKEDLEQIDLKLNERVNNMNCHGNHGNGKKGKSHLSHLFMMALCCGAPILLILLVPLFARVGGSGTANFISVIAPFLCPLMMVFMIPMMFRGRKDNEKKHDCCQDNTKQIGHGLSEE